MRLSPLRPVASATLLLLFIFAVLSVDAVSAQSTVSGTVLPITLDGTKLGRTFDGFGAVSGGGNTSRLLPDYPPKQRQEILDYLFKPQFGASINDLKVEVGGDVNSTQGSEPSHMHVAGDESYQRGFEWWLMEQAKYRNPNIILDCLAWGAPGWVGNGKYWSDDMMNYYIKFIEGAKKYHGLTISSVGGKNESGYDKSWYIAFRQALDANGLGNVKLIGSDDWGPRWLNIANDSLIDPDLGKALDVYAGHVSWFENPTVPSPALLATGKPLWDTEMHNYVPGTETGLSGFDAEISLVHSFNYNYIHAKITKTLFWYLIWSTYTRCSFPDIGMIRATSPWSGHYEVLPELWGYAHVDQFIKPGWHFLEGDGNGILPGGGTYSTLRSQSGDYSIIIETKGATASQNMLIALTGGLSSRTLHIWTSTAQTSFVHSADISPSKGSFTLHLDPNTIYSVTTTEGQSKGNYPASPEDHAFPLPYFDDYQSYSVGAQAKYHFDFDGSFEIAKRLDGKGLCLRQAATLSSSGWGSSFLPTTYLGDTNWHNYSVSIDTLIENSGTATLFGRVAYFGVTKNGPPGYALTLSDNGAWKLSTPNGVLQQGSINGAANQWHNLSLSFSNSIITCSIDGQQVASVTDTQHGYGMVGLGTSGNFAEFGNLSIQPGQ